MNKHKNKLTSGTKNSSSKNDKRPSTKTQSPEPKNDESCPIREVKPGQFLIPLAVKPGSKKDGISDILPDGISLHISAPPVDGEANSAILKYFVSLLPIKKTEIELRGGKSRSKTLVVNSPNITSASQILELLQKAKAEQN